MKIFGYEIKIKIKKLESLEARLKRLYGADALKLALPHCKGLNELELEKSCKRARLNLDQLKNAMESNDTVCCNSYVDMINKQHGHDLDRAYREYKALKDVLASSTNRNNELHNKNVELKEKVERQINTNKELSREIFNQKKLVAKYEKNIGEYLGELKETKKRLIQLNADKKEQERFENLYKVYKAKYEAAQNKNAELNKSYNNLWADVSKNISAKDSYIADLNNKINEKDNLIKSLTNKLDEAKASISCILNEGFTPGDAEAKQFPDLD